jgi:hypothetical protein
LRPWAAKALYLDGVVVVLMRQQCPKCGKGFDSGRGLRMHLREKHYGYYFTRFTATWLVVGVGVKVPAKIGITPD